MLRPLLIQISQTQFHRGPLETNPNFKLNFHRGPLETNPKFQTQFHQGPLDINQNQNLFSSSPRIGPPILDFNIFSSRSLGWATNIGSSLRVGPPTLDSNFC